MKNRSVNMRSIKGYCMRQARREVYRSMNTYYKNRNTYTNNNEVGFSRNDVLIIAGVIFGWVMLIVYFCSMGN
jgi:hypothetical protein